MKRLLFVAFLLTLGVSGFAQGKKIWAKSFLNKKAPELVVEKWISEKPNVEGKFVLIDFWATWCGPCRKAIPKMNEFKNKFSENLVVIGISKESENKIRGFKNPEIKYYSAIDTQAKMTNELEIKGIPHVILIDPKGIVRWEGFPDLEGHELTEKVIVDILKKYK